MRILHVIRSLDPSLGGVVECVRIFSEADIQAGFEVGIATLDAADSPWLGSYTARIHSLGTGKGVYGYAAGALERLRKVASEYDLLVVEGLWQYPSRLVHEVCGKEKPYVVYPHGMLDPWFRHGALLKHLKKSLYWLLVEYRVLREAKAVVFTAEEERNASATSFRPYQVNPAIIPLGIPAPPSEAGDIDRQASAWARLRPDSHGKPFALFLGRIHPKKGIDILLRAMGSARYKDWDLVVAGPGSESTIKELRQLAVEEGISTRVHWVGMLQGDAKWGAFRSAEVFCLPSHQENFGIAVVESLSMGTPVLISRRVNIWKEVVENGGGLGSEDQVDGYKEILDRWFDQPRDIRKAQRQKALACFMDRFEISSSAAKRRAFLTNLLQGSP
jgi:glycosyltransferase involved in cell wall biosynthesis